MKFDIVYVVYPPYSPDLAPNDHPLSPKPKEHLRGRIFSSDDDMICVANQ